MDNIAQRIEAGDVDASLTLIKMMGLGAVLSPQIGQTDPEATLNTEASARVVDPVDRLMSEFGGGAADERRRARHSVEARHLAALDAPLPVAAELVTQTPATVESG